MDFIIVFLVWLCFFPLVLANAWVRENFITPRWGELSGHQASSIIFSIVVFAGSYLFVLFHAFSYSSQELLGVGFFWTASTIVFEFGFGHYVMKHSWERLLADYNIIKGRLWVLVLLSTFFGPFLAGYLL